MVWVGENCIFGRVPEGCVFGRVPEGCGVQRTTQAWRPPHSHDLLLAGAGGGPSLGRCFPVGSAVSLGHGIAGAALQADSC